MFNKVRGYCPGCGKSHLIMMSFDCEADDTYVDVIKVWDEETMRYYYVMILPEVVGLGNPMEIVLGGPPKCEETMKEHERLMHVCAEFIQDIVQQTNDILDMLN